MAVTVEAAGAEVRDRIQCAEIMTLVPYCTDLVGKEKDIYQIVRSVNLPRRIS